MAAVPRTCDGEVLLHYRGDRHRFDRVFHRFPTLPSLTRYLVAQSRGKRVLNVGCVGARRQRQDICAVNELHGELANVCASLVGLDCDERGVELLRRAGFEVVCADACSPVALPQESRFDLVIAVHLIEHLCNPGLFLQNVRQWLLPGGHVMVATENPFFLNQTFKVLKYGSPMIHEEHTCLFDPVTMARLFSLNDFALKELFWIAPTRRRLQNLLLPFRRYWSQEFLAVGAPRER